MQDHVHTHTMYVGMGDARKSSFLCDGSIEKLLPLSRGLRIVTVQFTYTPIQCTWVWVMYGNIRFCVTFLWQSCLYWTEY